MSHASIAQTRHRHALAVIAAATIGTITAGTFAQEQLAKVFGSGIREEDNFGGHTAIDGQTMVVGAQFHDAGFIDTGAAFVFTRDGDRWVQAAKLLADDRDVVDLFGRRLDISGTTIIVGAHQNRDFGNNSGSAYIFDLVGGEWVQTAKLVPDDSLFGDQFGFHVAIDGDTAVIGANFADDRGRESGAIYVYERLAGVWTQITRLAPDDGQASDQFGWWVDVSGDTIVAGAPFHEGTTSQNGGAAYVFRKIDGQWRQIAKLVADDATTNDQFGNAVAIDGGLIAVAAPVEDGVASDTGSVYAFREVLGQWTQVAKLVADDALAIDVLGASIDVSGNTIIAGSQLNDECGNNAGAAYVFRDDGGLWTQSLKIKANDARPLNTFGTGVAISGNLAAIGSSNDETFGLGSGSAYVFDIGGGTTPCRPDFDGDGDLTLFDFLEFSNAFAAGDLRADFDGDRALTLFDFLMFSNEFAAGC